MPIIASEVMDESRSAYLNDTSATLYDNDALLPYLRIAFRQYQTSLNLLSNPDTEEVSLTLTVLSGTEEIPTPVDLVSPIKMEEFENNEFFPMKKVEWISGTEQKTRLYYWTYRENKLYVSGATRDVLVKLYYVKRLDLIGESSQIPIESAMDFLSSRTAALAAKFIGGNKILSDEIQIEADVALDKEKKRVTKGNQGFGTRRIPYWADHRHGEHSDGF